MSGIPPPAPGMPGNPPGMPGKPPPGAPELSESPSASSSNPSSADLSFVWQTAIASDAALEDGSSRRTSSHASFAAEYLQAR